MAELVIAKKDKPNPFLHWLLQEHYQAAEGPYEVKPEHQTHPWWQVVCLTGVDYFSSLGYQPGIAALAAGALSPVATLILVLLTLFGALPMYRRVAVESPHGDGSISMLERLLSWWPGKIFVLCLIGFAATSFIITITLSASDAAAHIVENPFIPAFMQGQNVAITLGLIALLAAIFLKGFKEAIGIAVVLVAIYLVLNLVVVLDGIYTLIQMPHYVIDWDASLFSAYSNPLVMLGVGLLLFPKLALGLSGFETGVLVMPLVRGDPADTEADPAGRIRNSKKLLTAAALIMSVLLITSSIVSIMLIPFDQFAPGGKANGRALAFLAHQSLGNIFGTVYDLSTIFILWFAGASAMAGLLNIVPRYLPRYGMAPDWTRATRPLVLVFTILSFAITIIFGASVDAQSSAYATGVLVLMTSAAIAVTISIWRHHSKKVGFFFGLIALIFIYATLLNIFERPDGVKIAAFFILAIIITSLVSRIWRSTELRVHTIELDEPAREFIAEVAQYGEIHIIANRKQAGDETEYRLKEQEQREDNRIPPNDPVLFLEMTVSDASEFADTLEVHGLTVGPYRILRGKSTTVPNAIAAFLLYVRDQTGQLPNAYFSWTEGKPIEYLLRFILFGEGDIAPIAHEVLRKAEPDLERRPRIHVGA